MKSSYTLITKPKDLILIRDSIIAETSDLDSVLPTVSTWDEYVYNDAESALSTTIRALTHAIEEKITTKEFLRFLRRLFIVSGKCVDDTEFHKLMVEMYQLEKYKEENKDEM